MDTCLSPDTRPQIEADIRFVHRSLRHLVSVLPASNGIALLGGPAALIWQAVQLGWNWRSCAILGFWVAGQSYIFLFGRIAQAIKDVWNTPSDGKLVDVARGVRNLICQHRNGLIHAAGVVALELWLIVLPSRP